MAEPAYEDEPWYDDQQCTCPNCDGSGEVACYCGGDLCVCTNYGDASCRVCHGEGEVTEERYARYMENQRRNYDMLRKIMERKNG